MILKTIQAANLKGSSFKRDVSPVTVFVGPSMSGKTCVLDAVRLGLLGYHPKLGKRPGDTLRLGQGGKLGVVLTFDELPGDVRKHPNGTRTVERTWATEGGVARAHGHEGPIVPTVGLDVREYFGMTGPERMRYVFAQIDMSDALSKEQLLARLQCVTPKEKPADGFITAVSDMARIVIDLDAARHEEDVSTQEFVDALIAKFTEAKKAADAACKQFAGLTQGSAQLRAAGDEAPARNVQGALAKEREEVGRLRGLVGATRTALDYNRKMAARIEWLEKHALDDSAKHEAAERLVRKQIKDLGEVADRILAKPSRDLLDRLIRIEGERKAAVERSKNIGFLIHDRTEKHGRNMALDCCPFCKSKTKGWKKAIQAEFEADKARHQKDFGDAVAEAEELKAQWEKVNAEAMEIVEAESEIAKARAELKVKRRELDDAVVAARLTADYATELRTLRARPEQAASQDLLDEQETALAAANERVDALAHEDRRYVAAKAKEAQTLEANAAHAVQLARAEVFKLAIAAVRELQQDMIDKAIGGLLATANKFTAGILRGPLDYKDGDIGYWRQPDSFDSPDVKPRTPMVERNWVSHECFSGTETALAYAGLSVALAQRSPFKLVIIDELGIVDDVTKEKILGRMLDLYRERVIDQALFCDVAKPLPMVGVEVVEVA